MANRISFEDQLGIPIWYEKGNLLVAGDYTIEHKSCISLCDLITQTVNSELCYPECIGNIYSIKETASSLMAKNILIDIINLHGTLLGIEFAKTKGIMTESPHNTYLQVIDGRCFIILQKSFFDEASYSFKNESTFIIPLERGQSLIIPPEIGYVIVNAQFNELFVLKAISSNAKECHVFDNHKGACCYFIHKNSQPEIVLNPYFKSDIQYKKLKRKYVRESKFFNKSVTIPEIIQGKPNNKELIDYIVGEKIFDLKKVL